MAKGKKVVKDELNVLDQSFKSIAPKKKKAATKSAVSIMLICLTSLILIGCVGTGASFLGKGFHTYTYFLRSTPQASRHS